MKDVDYIEQKLWKARNIDYKRKKEKGLRYHCLKIFVLVKTKLFLAYVLDKQVVVSDNYVAKILKEEGDD